MGDAKWIGMDSSVLFCVPRLCSQKCSFRVPPVCLMYCEGRVVSLNNVLIFSPNEVSLSNTLGIVS